MSTLSYNDSLTNDQPSLLTLKCLESFGKNFAMILSWWAENLWSLGNPGMKNPTKQNTKLDSVCGDDLQCSYRASRASLPTSETIMTRMHPTELQDLELFS